jgi:hypothetical protein
MLVKMRKGFKPKLALTHDLNKFNPFPIVKVLFP